MNNEPALHQQLYEEIDLPSTQALSEWADQHPREQVHRLLDTYLRPELV